MDSMIDARMLFLIPFAFAVVFVSWVFWNFSRELWSHRRRRVYRVLREPRAALYWPRVKTSARVRRINGKEAA